MNACCFLLLKKSPLFIGLSESELQRVSQSARAFRLTKTGAFFKQGQVANRVFVLTHGRVKITQITPEGSQVVQRIINPGEIFGIVAGFGESHYPASSVSTGPATAWSWDKNRILSLMDEYPRIAINTAGILSKRIQELQDRLRQIATENVERRVARMVISLAAKSGIREADGILIDFQISRQDLAEMTATTLFSVSRLLNQWEKAGIVKIARKTIKLISPHGLAQIAEE